MFLDTAPLPRRLGTTRRADSRRDGDAFFRSSPEMMRRLEEPQARDGDAGRYFVGSLEERGAGRGPAAAPNH